MIRGITLEVCAGSIEDVRTASAFDAADRIEFNSALELGGLTPGFASFLAARACTRKKLLCMCRPRPAGFRYTDAEKQVIREEARLFLEHGADGIVFGSLNDDLTVDAPFTKELADLAHAYGKEAVFHKAFDETPDLEKALQTLIRCGISRVLTGGGTPSAPLGAACIASLRRTYGDRIGILPGGGITAYNVCTLIRETGCSQVHMTAKEIRRDSGEYYAVSPVHLQRVIVALQSIQ